MTQSDVDGIPSYVAVDPAESGRDAGGLSRTPAILACSARRSAPIRSRPTGAIVDHASSVGYALETQTRPLFTRAPGTEVPRPRAGAPVVRRHGDAEAVARHLAERGLRHLGGVVLGRSTQGGPSLRQCFRQQYATPARSTGFWNPPPGDPGSPANLFSSSVYDRGAMTLEALREKIGGAAFFQILRDWVREVPVRKRRDAELHRPRRGRLGHRPRPFLRRLAVQEGEAEAGQLVRGGLGRQRLEQDCFPVSE